MMQQSFNRTINAERGGRGKSSRLNISVEGKGTLGEGIVTRVERVAVHNRRGESLSLAHKVIDQGAGESESLRDQVDVHEFFLRDPILSRYIIPTFRLTKDGSVTTDLSEKGKNIVFSVNERNEKGIKRLRAQHPDLSLKLSQVSDAKIQSQIEELASRAAIKGVRLGVDSVFMVILSNQSAKIYVADLDNVSIERNFNKDELYTDNLNQIGAILYVKDWLVKRATA